MTHAAKESLERAIGGYQDTALLHAAIQLDIPDRLAAGEMDAAALASEIGCQTADLIRLLRALELLDVCVASAPDRYRLTETGRCLLRDSPEPHRDLVELAVEQYWSPWTELAHSVRTGEPAFAHLHGVGPFEWRRQHEAAGRLFDRWLSKETAIAASTVVAGMDLTSAQSVVDVGGGLGALLAAVLERHPHLEGTLFDLEAVVGEAAARWPAVLAARTHFVAGDFFESVPVTSDVYVLKSVLHDWDDDQAAEVLRNCAASMSGRSRLMIAERLVGDPRGDDARSVRLDLHMMAVTGGRERTQDEYEQLVTRAGLSVDGIETTDAGFAIIEASL
jgi:SAM-dependent methyltransferase